MGTLERQIIEMFRHLSADSQATVLDALRDVASSAPVTLAAWLRETRDVRFRAHPDLSGQVPSASQLVNEAREDRDADLLRRGGLGSPAGDRSN